MQNTLQAVKRNANMNGKRLRKDGWIPCAVFGKGYDNANIQVRYADFKKIYTTGARKFYVEVTGGMKYLASIDEVQKHPVSNEYIHVNFHALKANEKATIHVPVHFTGTPNGAKTGGILSHMTSEVTITGYPHELPDEIVVDVSALDVGDTITVADIASNYKFSFSNHEMDHVLASCNYSKLSLVDETPATVETPVAETTAPVVEEKKAA